MMLYNDLGKVINTVLISAICLSFARCQALRAIWPRRQIRDFLAKLFAFISVLYLIKHLFIHFKPVSKKQKRMHLCKRTQNVKFKEKIKI